MTTSRDDIIKLAQLMMTDKYTRQYADPLYCFNEANLVAFFHAAQRLEREKPQDDLRDANLHIKQLERGIDKACRQQQERR